MYGGPIDGVITKRREKIMNDAYDQTVSETIELIKPEITVLEFDTLRYRVLCQIREIICSKSAENVKVTMIEGVMKAYVDVWDKMIRVKAQGANYENH